MTLENRKFVHARQTGDIISKEIIAHDVTLEGALAVSDIIFSALQSEIKKYLTSLFHYCRRLCPRL